MIVQQLLCDRESTEPNFTTVQVASQLRERRLVATCGEATCILEPEFLP
jgi:hypothetical protein